MVLMFSTFKQCSNLLLIFVNALSLNDACKEQMQHAICNHCSALVSMEHAHMLDFAVLLDKKMGALTLPESKHALTMQHCLLSMMAPDNSPLFLTVEKDHTGAGVWFSYAPKNQAKAAHRIAGLPLFLRKALDSTNTLKWFTPEAINCMAEMDWDKNNHRVITAEEKEMMAALNTYGSNKMQWVQFNLQVLLDEEAKHKVKLSLLTHPNQGDNFDQVSLATTSTNNMTGQAQHLLQDLTMDRQSASAPQSPQSKSSLTTEVCGTPPWPGTPPVEAFAPGM